jgi:phosphoribosylamine--glycine ligase
MRVLLLGSGGRENALAWKMAQSSMLEELYIAPGNAGTRLYGKNIAMSTTDFPAIKKFVLENQVNMVVVGPEEPLVKGIFGRRCVEKRSCYRTKSIRCSA